MTEKDYMLRFYEMVRCIGKDAAIKLHKEFGGRTIYIPKLNSLIRDNRNEEIYRRFIEGEPMQDIARDNDITMYMVQKIIRNKRDDKT